SLCAAMSFERAFAEEKAPDSALPGFTARQAKIVNDINDFEFDIAMYLRVDYDKAKIEFRILQSDLQKNASYLVVENHTFKGFQDWTLSSDEQYYSLYSANFDDVKTVKATYTAKSVVVKFFDGNTKQLIQEFVTSVGGTITPPTPNDYSSQGLVFVEWQGGEYSNVQRDTSIYSRYAPARILKISISGKTHDYVVAYGATVGSLNLEIDGKKINTFYDTKSGKKLDDNFVIKYNMELDGYVKSAKLPQWATITLSTVGGIAGAALAIWLTMKIIKHYGGMPGQNKEKDI
ncbi:MAG: hypothetical protein RR993_04740, partial [Clostridia bacterium]